MNIRIFSGLCVALAVSIVCTVSIRADPIQVFYLPIPEDDLLTALETIENNASWIPAAVKPQDPVQTYASISIFADNTVIHYDQWENGFDPDIGNPTNLFNSSTNPGGTQIWGDGIVSNGVAPGVPGDVLTAGTILLLTNAVDSTNRTAIDFDGGDKIAPFKPVAVTRAGWASGSDTLLAGAVEVFDTALWGTNFLSPVGVDIPDVEDAQQFEYTGFSIMTGTDGTTVRVDKDADGIFDSTNVINEGEAVLVNGTVEVGARVAADNPVQVNLLTADVFEGYESRLVTLLPVDLWSSSATTPVSTPESLTAVDGSFNTGVGTTVWLYNPAAAAITLDAITRTGAGGSTLTATPVTIPGGAAGGYTSLVVSNGFGTRFVSTNGDPFYAVANIDATGTGLSDTSGPGDNRTWDWGFTLVPEESLTPQVLVGLGIGRDPTSTVNPAENANPIWVTPIGNGNTSVTVYVDYDADPTTGPNIDANSNRYDAAFSARELDQLKIYNPSGDQSGMLIYVLDEGVEIAAAWGQDPELATPGAPGLDLGTGVPPLPLFTAQKLSVLAVDVDLDGFISPGDVLQYQVTIENIGRQPVPDLEVGDTLPPSVTYLSNTTFFVNAAAATSSIPDDAVPPAASAFPLDEGGIFLPEPALPIGGTWKVLYDVQILDFTNLPPGTIDLQNSATIGSLDLTTTNEVATPLRGKIGDFVWQDDNGDGFQNSGEPGVNGITVNLLTTNGLPVLDDNNQPITTVTANDTGGNPGFYQFLGIVAGDYVMEFIAPSGQVFTVQDADALGVAGSTNSDPDAVSGRTDPFPLLGGQTLNDVDAGLVEESSIGDVVWSDVDADGIRDPGEPGVSGVTVNLLDSGGNPVLDGGGNPVTTVTAADGSYSFEGLIAGDYQVEFVLPADSVFTVQDADSQGVAGPDNSDPVPATGRTPVFTLGPGEQLTTVDAGLLQADLAVLKSVDPASAAEGATVTYSIVVSNAGPTATTGVELTDPLVSGVTYQSDTTSQGSYADGSGVWTVGSLPAGATATLNLTATIDASTLGSALTNTASVTNTDIPDPVSTNDSDSAVVFVTDLAVSKGSDAGAAVIPGDIITYTIVVSNAGASAVSGLTVSDAVPDGATYVPGSVTGAFTSTAGDITNTVTYNSSGTFVVPGGVTGITVEAWGGGGGGQNDGNQRYGGGGGGAYARGQVAVTAGETNIIVVGNGGAAANTAGDSGGNSTYAVGGAVQVLAQGGSGGTTAGGAGGTASASVGDVTFSGGDGGDRSPSSFGGGGGGGGSATATGNGGNGANGAGTAGGAGGTGEGAGGDGGDILGAGNDGQVPGGGGGGRGRFGGNSGSGANGRVTLTYVQGSGGLIGPPPILASDVVLFSGDTLTLTFSVSVNDPVESTEVCNTVEVSAPSFPLPVSDNVCDPVDPSALAVIGDRVWFDENGDGIQDLVETNNLAGTPVYLYDDQTNLLASTATGPDGRYAFTNVVPGAYLVGFDFTLVATNNLTLTPPSLGGDSNLDSDGTSGAIGGIALTDAFSVSGGETNNGIDQGVTYLLSTRAEVAEVWGEAENGEARVVWTTRSEYGTAGFFVDRVDPETGASTRLNPTLMPASFQSDGARYQLADPMASGGDLRQYRLMEQEIGGTLRDLGVHEVVFAPPRPREKKPRGGRSLRALRMSASADSGPSDCLNLPVNDPGIVQISLEDIAVGMGRTLSEVQALASATQLSLTRSGDTVAYLHDAEGDRLIFYAQAATNWYTRNAVYRLQPGPGRIMARRDPGAGGFRPLALGPTRADTLAVRLRVEEDRYPFSSLLEWPEDFYYWDYIISGSPTAGQRSFSLDLSGYAGGPVQMRIELRGWSMTDSDPDHRARIRVNGVEAATISWDDQDTAVAAIRLPDGGVTSGQQTVTVEGVLQPGQSHSFFVVEAIEVDFLRSVVPVDGTFLAEAGPLPEVSAAAYSDPLVLSVGDASNPVRIADGAGDLPGESWSVTAAGERFAIIESEEIPSIDPEPAACSAWFLATTNRIDYLIIAPRELAAAAEPLADYRAGQGLRTGVAVFEEVVDLFAHGQRTPEAIPALLAYAESTWEAAPWLVVLAGNGHYDYLNTLNLEPNLLPPMLRSTGRGLFATDSLLADLDRDGVPDKAIGRLPALDANDLSTMIAKIQAREADYGAEWQHDLTLAADRIDAGGNFSAANASIADQTDGAVSITPVDLNQLEIAPARSVLLGAFEAGSGIIHYTGHGGRDNLSGDNLLTGADAEALMNDRHPLVIALSCLVGRYEAPGVDSLGELLLRQPGGGAAAVWGPSGLSQNDPAVELGRAWYRAVMRDGADTLGLAILQAQRAVFGQAERNNTYVMYNLLGDPAMKVGAAPVSHGGAETFAQWRWAWFTPSELAQPGISGHAGDTNENGLENFLLYALGLPPDAERPESIGITRIAPDTGDGVIIEYTRRIVRKDHHETLRLSENLRGWGPDGVDVSVLSITPHPDGRMETVRLRVDRPEARSVFIQRRIHPE